MYRIKLDAEGRVVETAYSDTCLPESEGTETAALPEGEIFDYIYKEGEFIYSPLPRPQPGKSSAERIEALEKELSELKAQSDENTLAVAELYGGSI